MVQPDLAFSLAASLELPALFVPLSGATMAAHWSLVRSRGHYPTDVLAGGALAVVLTVVLWRLWPPSGTRKKPEREVPTAVPAVASPTRGGFRDP